MRDNQRIADFLNRLEDKGVRARVHCETRRDGKRGKPDMYLVEFVGWKTAPAIGTAVIIDYGERDGFGLWLESPSNRIEADVDAIIGIEKAA